MPRRANFTRGELLLALQPRAIDCPGGVDAIILSNGRNEGPQDIVQTIYDKRSGVYKALFFSEPLVEAIATSGADPNTVAAALKAHFQSISQQMAVSAAEWEGQAFVFGVVAGLLEHQNNFHVPSDSTPNHQPRIDSVMELNNIPRQQAHAIVINKKLHEWSSALEGHLQPVS